MRLMHVIGWKTLLCSMTVGVVIYLSAMWSIPYSPRFTLALESYHWHRLAYSGDCRYVALFQGHQPAKKNEWKGEICVWDTQERRRLFAVPYSETKVGRAWAGARIAFLPDRDQLVIFLWGRAAYYSMPTGEPWVPQAPQEFPNESQGSGFRSQLVFGSDGLPYVLVLDDKKSNASIRTLSDGIEICKFPVDHRWTHALSSAILVADEKNRIQIRDVPSGKCRFEYEQADFLDKLGSFAITPDGRTFLHALDGIRIWKDGEEHKLPMDIVSDFDISPDGTQFAAFLLFKDAKPSVFTKIATKLGREPDMGATVLYDIDTGKELARVPTPGEPHFARDGQTLAISNDDAVHFYDYPLQKPWGKIVGLACVASIVSYTAGRWIGRKRHLSKPRA